jgi:hypothetical protein
MRVAQFSRWGPEVSDIVALPESTPGPGRTLHDVSTTGLDHADTHTSTALEQTIL